MVIMGKLISMTDFVLSLNTKKLPKGFDKHISDSFEFSTKCIKYANFLKQELNIGMFVPAKKVNGVWVVLEEPYNDGENSQYFLSAMEEYQESKENVLFEVFIVSENSGNIIVTNGRNSILFSIRNFVKHIESGKRIFNIECVHSFDLTLTQSAKNQLDL